MWKLKIPFLADGWMADKQGRTDGTQDYKIWNDLTLGNSDDRDIYHWFSWNTLRIGILSTSNNVA